MRMNAQNVKFSNSRRKNKAVRGELTNVGTSSTTAETDSEFSKRTGQLSFAQEKQRSSAVGRVLVIIVLVVVVVAVGYGVGSFVFYNQLGSRFSIDASETPSGLISQPANPNAYYVAVSADLDSSNGNNSVDALQLVRVDPSAKQLTVVSIPTNLSVTLSDNKTHAISEALDVGGNSELISALSKFSGVSISHFVKTDEAGIRKLASIMGGFRVNVAEEVDDPTAGSIYIPKGEQTLGADELMVFLRASNYKDSISTQLANQALVLAMAVEYFVGTGADVESRLDGASGTFKATWQGQKLCDSLSALGGFSASKAYRASVPGGTESVDNKTLFVDTTSSWLTMMKKVEAGEEPIVEAKGTINDIYAGAYTVTVKNGSGIDGGATTIANILKEAGFNVTATGNADSYVYTETLVVYGNDTLKVVADAAVGVLGSGRATEAGVYYSYDTDLLVILGSDWKPAS